MLAALVLAGSARGDDAETSPWQKLSERHGFRVSRNESGAVTTYRVEGVVQANLFDLMAVVADIPGRLEWVDSLQEARVLEGDVEDTVVIYEQYRLPWPCENRDSVVESVIHKDLEKLEVAVDYREVRSESEPARSHVVRMPVVRGGMVFRYLDKQSASVQVTIGVDMGGDIPRWIVEGFAKEAPLRTVEALGRQVEKTRGRYDAFVLSHAEAARARATIPFEVTVTPPAPTSP